MEIEDFCWMQKMLFDLWKNGLINFLFRSKILYKRIVYCSLSLNIVTLNWNNWLYELEVERQAKTSELYVLCYVMFVFFFWGVWENRQTHDIPIYIFAKRQSISLDFQTLENNKGFISTECKQIQVKLGCIV